jgi:hypothetical protein
MVRPRPRLRGGWQKAAVQLGLVHSAQGRGLGSDNVHSLAGGSIVGVQMVPEPDFACFQRYTRTTRLLDACSRSVQQRCEGCVWQVWCTSSHPRWSWREWRWVSGSAMDGVVAGPAGEDRTGEGGGIARNKHTTKHPHSKTSAQFYVRS